jgi:hypothetical protein
MQAAETTIKPGLMLCPLLPRGKVIVMNTAAFHRKAKLGKTVFFMDCE